MYKISKDELNALLYMYYGILYSCEHSKGLIMHKSFQAKKQIINLIPEVKKININDFIEVDLNEC